MSRIDVLNRRLTEALNRAMRHMDKRFSPESGDGPRIVDDPIVELKQARDRCQLIDDIFVKRRIYNALLSQGEHCPKEPLEAARIAALKAEAVLDKHDKRRKLECRK
jgi:hypothetical protein